MNLLKCPDCREPLILEVGLIIPHNISADGQYFVDSSFFSWSSRLDENLVCKSCGRRFVENLDWKRDEKGRIRLRMTTRPQQKLGGS